MRKFFFIISFLIASQAISQDSLRVMYHNVLNFPGATPGRADSLRKILQYYKPDVYVINELQTAAGADLILNNALNVFGTSNYQRATFADGYDTDNGLFYNSDKLGLVSQQQIGTSLRDISEYVLYYKAPNLTAVTDTIYLHFYSCHLKAGSSDYEQRNQEALQLKYYLNSKADKVENVFAGGDFNFYSGFESGCQTLLNFGSIPLYDPVDMIGNWSNSFSFADYHTQSSRINTLSDGSGGGLDDRFDLILVSDDVFNNQNGVTYVPDSYGALGQDGNRLNGSVLTPTNNSVPDSVANALYYASDHLPVYMTVVFDETASITKVDETTVVLDSFYKRLILPDGNVSLRLYDLLGKEVKAVYNAGPEVDLSNLPNGIYLWQMEWNDQFYSDKIILQ